MLRDVFKSIIPISFKRKTIEQCVLPVMAYGAEMVMFTKTASAKLRVRSEMYGKVSKDWGHFKRQNMQ